MQQLPEEIKKSLEDLNEKFDSLPLEKKTSVIAQMTEIISAMNQDVKGMVEILQSSKDKRELEKITSRIIT